MKKYILRILPYILIFVMLFGMNVSAATGESDGYDTTYLVASSLGKVVSYDFLLEHAIAGFYAELGIGSDTPIYYIVPHGGTYSDSTAGLDVMISLNPFYCAKYPSSKYVFFDSASTIYMVVVYTSDGGVSLRDPISVNAVGTSYQFLKVRYIESSHNVFYGSSNQLILEGSFIEDTGSDDSSYDHNYSPKNEIIDDGYEFGSTLENIQTETLVSADEEPNVFLRVFKNISIMVSNTGKYVQALYGEITHAIDYFFNEIVPEVFFKTMSEIHKTVFDILNFFNGFYENIKDTLLSVFSAIWTYEVIDGLSLHSIWEFFEDKLNTIGEYISGLSSGEITASDIIISALPDRLEELINGFYNLGYQDMEFSLAVMFERLLVPEDGYFENKIDTVVLSKFGFIDAGYAFIDSIQSVLNQTETAMPVITTDSFEWNGVTIPSFTISFEWYERFKPYVDPIVSAFCWIVFVYHTIVNLPSLFRGGSVVGNAYKDYMADVEVKNRASSDADKIARNYGWK